MAKLRERDGLAGDVAVDNVLRSLLTELHHDIANFVGESRIADEGAVKCFLLRYAMEVAQRHYRLLPEQVKHPVNSRLYPRVRFDGGLAGGIRPHRVLH